MYYSLILLSVIITLGAQIYVNSTYKKTRKIKNKKGITGAEVARTILDKNGLSNVNVVSTKGTLSDHYDPKSKVVRLSQDVYNSPSVASISVAAHECGHAIQDKNGYIFMRIRSALVPVVNFSSYAGYIAIMIGALFSLIDLIWIGIILECAILVFQLITLPVEFDASSRSLKEIKKMNILDQTEYKKGKSMLTAAAMTYVASVATTLLEILRLVLVFTNRRD